jgi:hypothetical protein
MKRTVPDSHIYRYWQHLIQIFIVDERMINLQSLHQIKPYMIIDCTMLERQKIKSSDWQ